MDKRRSVLENALQPLVNGLVEISPTVVDASIKVSKSLIMLPVDCCKLLIDITTGKYKHIEEELDLKEQLEITNIVKYKYFPLDDLERSFINPKFIKYEYIEGDKKGIRACIGCNMEGEPKWFDILDGHTLVAGASGWGKSSFLNTFITYILMTYTENEVCFKGYDGKASDVYYFRRYKHFKGEVATNKEQFIQHMNDLEKVINKRKEVLDKLNCRNAINYNKKHEPKMPYVVYVIDELPQLTSDNECSNLLRLMMAKCRSYGIYFILATQDATKDTIGKCKMNCSQVVGFHTKDTTDSKTIINSDILESIKVVGRSYIDTGREIEQTQIFFLEEDEIEDLLKDKLKEKYKQLQEQEG